MPEGQAAVIGVVADLEAESAQLDTLVAGLDDAGWATPTPAPGWTIAHQIAHLAWTDEVAAIAATDPDRFGALLSEAASGAATYVDDAAEAGAAAPADEILAGWRAARDRLADALREVPAGVKIPWFGPPMSAASMATARLMETWAHGLDVADALGVPVVPTDRIRSVAHIGVRTRDFAYIVNGRTPPAEPFHYALTAPSGEIWTWGPDDASNSVRGPALDFCFLVTQRRALTDLDLDLIGPDAVEWSGIAQCFAGPPGPGREPRAS
ncbi:MULTISPECIES: TIGR03084 family metal-binding protein [unclassified Gordonia (in: high G+C Gram-positive bacteria)]|uniref:TIGR03084 family metal-binding protein n=1 Tax=unclassified Gordonia (in: high G+C Gram-positive bacteria) TaxID=2657482 RepID=UPI001965B1F9|nr:MULTISPECIES: TIGR03084 family metal-binding protein [unclassified Gordonia (in: high G+C Gram-positive bacteria)]MBN0973656.1 TIGR03084 family protein [Gordonia sp. BP-119]MBN0983538.1 TIGR03084 family protein [Gordonia sp. BP-94]WGJ84750.1 TIGR03084 family metal-binding protein [Gordonia sp. SMJS1]